VESKDPPPPADDGSAESPPENGDSFDEEAVLARAAEVDEAARMVRLAGDYSHPPRQKRVLLPIVLFVATCLSTFWTGSVEWMPALHMNRFQRAGDVFLLQWQQGMLGSAIADAGGVLVGDWQRGLLYMAAVMGILLTHEMGHFVMAVRNRIPASLPFFIPVPILPFGTMGAVIGMQGSRANRRQLFDLGIAGPLAGLAIAVPVTWFGILQLNHGPQPTSGITFYNPLIFTLLIDYLRPDFPSNTVLYMSQFNPLLMAGWVGMLVTGLNTLPISQLDGGHVAYALLGRRRAHLLARSLIVAAIIAILCWEAYMWVLMLVLVIAIGIHHPPTADDSVDLGWSRRSLGYASLAIPVLCFPPMRIA